VNTLKVERGDRPRRDSAHPERCHCQDVRRRLMEEETPPYSRTSEPSLLARVFSSRTRD